MKWNLVKNGLPEIGQEVLCFYTIGDNEYFCVGSIRMISSQITGVAGNYTEDKSVDWKDVDGNIFEPTHWCPITPPLQAGVTCDHNTSVLVSEENGVEKNLCTWACGEHYYTRKVDGITQPLDKEE